MGGGAGTQLLRREKKSCFRFGLWFFCASLFPETLKLEPISFLIILDVVVTRYQNKILPFF